MINCPLSLTAGIAGAFILLTLTPGAPAQVSDREIDAAIQKGVDYLMREKEKIDPRSPELLAYTLFRANFPKKHAVIQSAIRSIQTSIRSDGYRPGQDGYYQAGLAALLLEAVDPVEYKSELQSVARYILDGQHSAGYWDYPNQDRGGDTSISQYALLGLWAAEHTGMEIPPSVWDKAASWLLKNQRSGGFVYHPTEPNVVTYSMTAAGCSSLMLCRRELFPGESGEEVVESKKKVAALKKKPTQLYGILKLVDLGTPDDKPDAPKTPAPVREVTRLKLSELNSGIRRSVNWLDDNFAVDLAKAKKSADGRVWNYYYLYGLERVGSFGELEMIGNHDWYKEGARFLVNTQQSDGHWKGTESADITTCLSLLFLVKATGQALGEPRRREPKVGTGLLAAGRGLPDDLKKVQMKNGRIETLADDQEVTDLLSQLEAGSTADLAPEEKDKKLEQLEQAVIETVRVGNREQLIGQVDRLQKLVGNPSPEIRRIALWALARSNNLTVAPLFIERLQDGDLDVAIEANQGLCILSRKLKGVGVPDDPLKGIRDQRPAEELKEIANRWRKQATDRWRAWYLSIRPYSERDDLLDHTAEK